MSEPPPALSRPRADDQARPADLLRPIPHQQETSWDAEERWNLLMEQVRDHAIFLLDPGGRVASWNRGAERLLGYTEAEILGQPVACIFTPEDRLAGVPERELRRAEARSHTEDQRWQLRKDGARFWAGGTLTSLRTRDGTLQGFAKILRDLTERQRMVDDLRQAREELEARVAERTAELAEALAALEEEVAIRRQAQEELQKEREFLKAVLEDVADGIVACDAEGVLTLFNRAARIFHGKPAEPTPADRWAEDYGLFLPDGRTPMSKEDTPLYRALRGEHVRNVEMVILTHGGSVCRVLCAGQPLRDARGNKLGAVVTMHDVTEQRRAEEGLRQKTAFLELLQAVTVAANQSLALEEALRLALDRVCAHTGWPVGHAYTLADGGELVCASLWHLEDPQQFGPFRQATGSRRFRSGVGLPGQVLASGKPAWVRDVTDDSDFSRAGPAREVGLRAAFAFPVLVGTEVIAVLEFFDRHPGEPDAPLLEVMASIGTQLGRVVERQRRRQAESTLRATQEEFRLARQIHEKLFPAAAPTLPGFDIAALSRPAQATGGDYFDYIPLPGPAVGVVVGDVSGHGFGPALMMSQARAYLRALALMYADVSELLTRANQVLAEDTEEDRFITLFLARLGPGTRSLLYAGAGHDGYLLPASGGVTRLRSTGLPLGILRDAVIGCGPAQTLATGDLVLLFTDGIPEAEAPDGTRFGPQRAVDLVCAHRARPAREIIEALDQAVRDFTHPNPQADDITAVVIRVES